MNKTCWTYLIFGWYDDVGQTISIVWKVVYGRSYSRLRNLMPGFCGAVLRRVQRPRLC